MTNLVRYLARPPEERSSFPLPFQQWVDIFKFNNVNYPLGGFRQTLLGNREEISGDYGGLIQSAYKANGIIFACMLVRMLHFTEARLQFRQIRAGRPGNLFGNQDLGILEKPWPNGTTGDLLARMIQDVDLAGNAYIVRDGDRLARLRPDYVGILLGSRRRRDDWVPGDPDTEVIGYMYHPKGVYSDAEPLFFDTRQVAHFAPIPDPDASYRGMSWLTPIIREVQADQAMTTHRIKFLEQGATVNLIVELPKEAADTQAQFQEWVNVLRTNHEGLEQAYKMMFLGMGATAKPVGADMQQMDFRAVQGAGEVRIATAARVPPTILGISEGLSGSSLNAGNYQMARRNLADGCIRPLWRQACGALASIINVPGDAELWYDDRDIAFLKEDLKDAAEVQQMQASAMKSLIDGGYTPESVRDAITADDFSRLVHSGLVSVQLLPPGTANGSSNGNGKGVSPIPAAQLGA